MYACNVRARARVSRQVYSSLPAAVHPRRLSSARWILHSFAGGAEVRFRGLPAFVVPPLLLLVRINSSRHASLDSMRADLIDLTRLMIRS
jgi:hypothetical protein